MSDDKQEGAIKKILEEEHAFVHVALHYIIKTKGGLLKRKRDGRLDHRNNISRLVAKLNAIVHVEGVDDSQNRVKCENNPGGKT